MNENYVENFGLEILDDLKASFSSDIKDFLIALASKH
jgi:hypothetical protein